MPKLVITAEVNDRAMWEEGFRTHGDLFRRQTVKEPIRFGAIDGNQVAILFEPEDLDTFMKIIDSRETEEAMAMDGVKRDTVKFFVMDKEFQL